ncbi:MAG TPA: ATP-dependent DNA helicase [Candidatus Saccharimonadales bacterium]|nr:ATP-dependent DNA helicase [Candidatus Saccharimonadales bacterium]
MKKFEELLGALNPAQRQAVDTIEGPVLVVAGPGTGKTQLLSMRAASIVARTDALPNNILCLTFTDSAAMAMRQRLIELMGPEGNKVTVHTFHSFGTEVINKYPEFFWGGAPFTPASDMASYEILRDIFGSLPHNNPLATTMNSDFTYLADAQRAISHLRRAGITPDELLHILDHNQDFCTMAEPLFGQAFQNRLSKKTFPLVAEVHAKISQYQAQPMRTLFVRPLAVLCANELQTALDHAQATGKTTPLTTWKNRWCEKDATGTLVMKHRKQAKKLRALADIYTQYRAKLSEAALFDFDDMVSTVAHTLETQPELRFALQEQYLYVMVDEFQDTNGAQLRLLDAIADSPVNEGRPNILAVGDDDQAIYSFQGAELSNILDFTQHYRDVAVITLTENYRSTAPILHHARAVITQGADRLETTIASVNKELTPHVQGQTSLGLHQHQTPDAERQWVATHIKQLLGQGVPAPEIAVLARTHKQLMELVPFLRAAGVHVAYERRDNVIDRPHIRELLTLAEVVTYLSEQRFDLVEALLPELLSFSFWHLTTMELWRLSLSAYKENRMWLEVMLEQEGRLQQIAEFLIVASHKALHEPLDTMLDLLIGTAEAQAPTEASDDQESSKKMVEEFTSPYRAYFFNEQQLAQNPAEYLRLLSNIQTLRRAAQAFRPGVVPTLSNLIDLVDLHERTKTPILDTADQLDSQAGVRLMTAHKAKGLEFTTVFVVGCQDEAWGRSARKKGSGLSFPHNLPIEPAGSRFDDSLRLFFVAMTRAKRALHLSWHATTATGKPTILAEFLQGSTLPRHTNQTDATPPVSHLTPGWEQHWLRLPKTDQKAVLAPFLEKYKLSATHVNNFVDVTRGGPQAFLLQNILRFPQAMTPSQVYGRAVHAVLQRAHTHLSATGERRPVEDILHDYEIHLQNAKLSHHDFEQLLEKGSAVLQHYLQARHHTFTPGQKAERDFYTQHVTLPEGVRLTGAIDVMTIDKPSKTITITDYKTGKSFSRWFGVSDYDKVKLHKYKQQLMFYKLLIEHSRDFAGYTVTKGVLDFVEPDANGQLWQLEMQFNAEELAEFSTLIKAVWQRVVTLDLPDVHGYDQTYKGIVQFERDITTENTRQRQNN